MRARARAQSSSRWYDSGANGKGEATKVAKLHAVLALARYHAENGIEVAAA